MLLQSLRDRRDRRVSECCAVLDCDRTVMICVRCRRRNSNSLSVEAEAIGRLGLSQFGVYSVYISVQKFSLGQILLLVPDGVVLAVEIVETEFSISKRDALGDNSCAEDYNEDSEDMEQIRILY